jgi:hypothetical protein
MSLPPWQKEPENLLRPLAGLENKRLSGYTKVNIGLIKSYIAGFRIEHFPLSL